MISSEHDAPERISLSLDVWRGPCPGCGEETELFAGKRYCDDCIRRLEVEAWAQERDAWVRDMLATAAGMGLIAPATATTRFDGSLDPPPHNSEAWEAAIAWRRDVNVYLHGPCGVGKSHLARCMLYEAMGDGLRIGEVSGHSVASASAYKPEQVDALAWPDVLLIDDIDKGAWGAQGIVILREALDRREQARRRTILTANADKRELMQYLTRRAGENKSLVPAALDRLNTPAGRPLTLHLTGRSLRGAFGGGREGAKHEHTEGCEG